MVITDVEEVIRRGDNAARILAEPVVKEALESMKAEIIRAWSETPARDAEAREWVWRQYKAVEKFEGLLKGYMETGKFERKALLMKQRPMDKVAGIFSR